MFHCISSMFHILQNILAASKTVVQYKQNKKYKKYSDFLHSWSQYCFKEKKHILDQGTA